MKKVQKTSKQNLPKEQVKKAKDSSDYFDIKELNLSLGGSLEWLYMIFLKLK